MKVMCIGRRTGRKRNVSKLLQDYEVDSSITREESAEGTSPFDRATVPGPTTPKRARLTGGPTTPESTVTAGPATPQEARTAGATTPKGARTASATTPKRAITACATTPKRAKTACATTPKRTKTAPKKATTTGATTSKRVKTAPKKATTTPKRVKTAEPSSSTSFFVPSPVPCPRTHPHLPWYLSICLPPPPGRTEYDSVRIKRSEKKHKVERSSSQDKCDSSVDRDQSESISVRNKVKKHKKHKRNRNRSSSLDKGDSSVERKESSEDVKDVDEISEIKAMDPRSGDHRKRKKAKKTVDLVDTLSKQKSKTVELSLKEKRKSIKSDLNVQEKNTKSDAKLIRRKSISEYTPDPTLDATLSPAIEADYVRLQQLASFKIPRKKSKDATEGVTDSMDASICQSSSIPSIEESSDSDSDSEQRDHRSLASFLNRIQHEPLVTNTQSEPEIEPIVTNTRSELDLFLSQEDEITEEIGADVVKHPTDVSGNLLTRSSVSDNLDERSCYQAKNVAILSKEPLFKVLDHKLDTKNVLKTSTDVLKPSLFRSETIIPLSVSVDQSLIQHVKNEPFDPELIMSKSRRPDKLKVPLKAHGAEMVNTDFEKTKPMDDLRLGKELMPESVDQDDSLHFTIKVEIQEPYEKIENETGSVLSKSENEFQPLDITCKIQVPETKQLLVEEEANAPQLCASPSAVSKSTGIQSTCLIKDKTGLSLEPPLESFSGTNTPGSLSVSSLKEINAEPVEKATTENENGTKIALMSGGVNDLLFEKPRKIEIPSADGKETLVLLLDSNESQTESQEEANIVIEGNEDEDFVRDGLERDQSKLFGGSLPSAIDFDACAAQELVGDDGDDEPKPPGTKAKCEKVDVIDDDSDDEIDIPAVVDTQREKELKKDSVDLVVKHNAASSLSVGNKSVSVSGSHTLTEVAFSSITEPTVKIESIDPLEASSLRNVTTVTDTIENIDVVKKETESTSVIDSKESPLSFKYEEMEDCGAEADGEYSDDEHKSSSNPEIALNTFQPFADDDKTTDPGLSMATAQDSPSRSVTITPPPLEPLYTSIKPSSRVKTPDLPPFDEEEYRVRRHLPRKFPRRRNDVYVTLKTDFQCQITRCRKLFHMGYSNVYIHGLGLAVNRAINLALVLKSEHSDVLEMGVHTSTMELTEDLVPLTEEGQQETRTRVNSAVHIRLNVPKATKIYKTLTSPTK